MSERNASDRGLFKLAILVLLCTGLKFYEGMSDKSTIIPHQDSHDIQMSGEISSSTSDSITIIEYNDAASTLTQQNDTVDSETLAIAHDGGPSAPHL